MNILKRELRAGRKAFLFWMIGMFLLCYAGIIKYQSFSMGSGMMEILDSLPRIVLALMGAAGADLNTLGGYTAMLYYYVLVCVVIYAVHLGSSAVSRESVDKTYDFLFTKPCSRAHVLAMKCVSAYAYLALFCALTGVFSVMAVAYLNTTENVTALIARYSVSVFLIGALFIALAAFLSSVATRPEKGAMYGNLAFLYAFLMGMVYNMLEDPGLLKLVSPFNYFASADLIAGRLDPAYTVYTFALAAALLFGAFRVFGRKDFV